MSDQELASCLDALQIRYIRALDMRQMDAWVACFDADASYVCIARENDERQLPLAVMMDDNRARIQDRANYVTKVWDGTFEDYSTRHFVQRLRHQRKEASLYEMESNFMVAYTEGTGKSNILVTGTYQDLVSLHGGEAVLRSRRAVLDTVTTPRYLVYPV
ncbi:MAG: hypothetical protein J0H09_11970 [Burkholderiales bacterium]|nr:hypothetical protein [Burkholderiales bacterium]